MGEAVVGGPVDEGDDGGEPEEGDGPEDGVRAELAEVEEGEGEEVDPIGIAG